MNDAIAVALITGGLALTGTIGVALLQIVPAPRRLERQVNSLKTLAPLVEKDLPDAREAFHSVARQIVRAYRIRPWWHRIIVGLIAVLMLAATIATAWFFNRFLSLYADPVSEYLYTWEGAAELVGFIVAVATLATATLTTGLTAIFARYEPVPSVRRRNRVTLEAEAQPEG